MRSILEFHFPDAIQNKQELQQVALEEVARCISSGDFLGAGEWYASMIALPADPDAELVASRVTALWAAPEVRGGFPDNFAEVTAKSHEYVAGDLAVALVAAVSIVQKIKPGITARLNDLVFKITDGLVSSFGIAKSRPIDLLNECVAKRAAVVAELERAVDMFLRSDTAGAKIAGVELLKSAKTFKQIAVPAERPLLSEIEMLLGPTFRSFFENAQRRNTTGAAKHAPLLREQASGVVTNIGPKQNSTVFYGALEPIAKHILSLVDDDARRTETATTPALSLGSSLFKLDLTKVGREMTFSCRLTNQGEGIAQQVFLEAGQVDEVTQFRIVDPSGPFEVGAKAEQIVTFEIALRLPCEKLVIPIKWHCTTIAGRKHTGVDSITILKQRVQPDWLRLRREPPYGLNSVKTKDKLFGRDTLLAQLMIYAAAGTSTFVWGAKRVGKTSIVQVLESELRNSSEFVAVFLRMGELAALHEGQIAHTIAERLWQKVADPRINVPVEGAFGAGLARLIPVMEDFTRLIPQKKFIAIVDEFDDFDPAFYTGQRGKLFVKALRSLSEVGLTFFFVGSERMDPIYKAHSADLNKWESLYLDTIQSREDCKSLILQPVRAAIEYHPDCVDKIVNYCGGNPFYMHLVCSEVFNRCANEERTFVGESDLHSVQHSRCRTMGETNFAHFWEDNPELDESVKHEQAAQNCLVLSCVAILGKQCCSATAVFDAQDRIGLGHTQRLTLGRINEVIERLRNRKVVTKNAEGFVDITLPIFRDWLRNNAELRLVPRWKEFCNLVQEREQRLEPTLAAPFISESSFPIAEDDLLPVAHKLVYCGKEKDVAEIRSWLRQFDDEVRIEVAFLLLRRLAESGFVNEGTRRHRITVIEEAIETNRKTIGGGVWRVVNGKKSNLCVSYVDSVSEMKSGAAAARDLASGVRPGKRGAFVEVIDWMKNNKNQDPLVVLVDEFSGSGSQMCNGLRKILEGADSNIVNQYLDQGRVLCCLLNSFPEAVQELRTQVKGLKVVSANYFADEVRSLEPEAHIFENEADLKFAGEMLLQIGTELLPQMPLGWARIGALVCFHNTIPNNTLPIFWSNGKVNEKAWNPLFPRP